MKKLTADAMDRIITAAKRKFEQGGLPLLSRYCDLVLLPLYGEDLTYTIYTAAQR